MKQTSVLRGWQIHHHEQLIFRASSGASTLRVKFFHYSSYRQTVQINQPPAQCKLKKKGMNTFYVFQQKVRTKGTVSFERIVSVIPQPTRISMNNEWGFFDIPQALQRKYKQHFSYWPVNSHALDESTQQDWFTTEDLKDWVANASRYITGKIKYPEKQDKRLGADQALLTGIGDCDEFTDLFITMARMRGIPCRRLTGYFIDIPTKIPEPHAWAELLSPTQGWIPIDIALHTIGLHNISYVIDKIEEFNPSLYDYQVKHPSGALHYHWEQPLPDITPLYSTDTDQA